MFYKYFDWKPVLKGTILWIVFRKYLPVLKGFPAKYIHAPWTAPESVQKAARCIIGKDYPRPMVDHNKVSSANLEKMRNVFKALLCYKESSKSWKPASCFWLCLLHPAFWKIWHTWCAYHQLSQGFIESKYNFEVGLMG